MKKQVLFTVLMLSVSLVWAGKPNNTQVVSVASTQATLSWGNGTCNSIGYTLQYKSLSAGTWTAVSNILNKVTPSVC